MLASSSTKQRPKSYTISTQTITTDAGGYISATRANSCCIDGSGNIYTFGSNISSFPTFTRTDPGGSTIIVGGYNFDTAVIGFAVAADGSIFFAWNYTVVSSNKIMRLPPYSGSQNFSPTNLFNLPNSQSIYGIAVNNDGTKVYLQFGSALNAYSNWNGVTASSNGVLGLGGAPYGLSVDRSGNICASSTNGLSYVSAAGSNYSLTATVPQSNPSGVSGTNSSSIVLDIDAQPIFFSGNTPYKGTMAGASTQLSTSNLGNVYGVCVNPATDVISVLTTIASGRNATLTNFTPTY